MRQLRPRGVTVVAMILALGAMTVMAQSERTRDSEGRTGTGHELKQDCNLYFSFLGRTGAGREETHNEDPFGMGYCAGLVRGVGNSMQAFHPEIDCRLGDFTFHEAVWAVVDYLNNRPQTLDEPDTVLVLRALQVASICSATVP